MRISRTIEAPAEVVWQIFTDTESWPRWGPSVSGVDAPARHITEGMRGRIETALGPAVTFEITRCDPLPHACWEWKVLGIPATTHHVEALGEDRCRASFTLPAIALPYALVCKRALREIERLALEQHREKRSHRR
jgi:hypothetical protein